MLHKSKTLDSKVNVTVTSFLYTTLCFVLMHIRTNI